MCKDLLTENGIATEQRSQKKYLKKLITEHFDDVEFVQSHRRNESAQVASKKLLGAIVTELRESQKKIRHLSKAATIIRQALLGAEHWKFNEPVTILKPQLSSLPF